MSDQRSRKLARIQRAAFTVELRMRLGRVLFVLPPALCAALAGAAATLVVRKIAPHLLSEERARHFLIGCAVFVALMIAAALLRRLPPKAGTLALDRAHNLHDRLTNALVFQAMPEGKRTALMEVAIDDALEHSEKLRASKAAPMRIPKDWGVALMMGAAVVALSLLEIRIPRKEEPKAATIDALVMSPDDLELFRDAARELAKDDQNPETKAAIDKFNQLIEDIANKRLDRTEAFRRMEELERDLLKGAEMDRKALDEALEQTGQELSKSDLAKKAGESLKKKDLEQAKKDLQELAEKLRDKKKKPSKEELERLKQALEKASKQRKEALAAVNEKRAELREELLKKKQEQKDKSDAGTEKEKSEEEKLLKKKERELERLDREAEQKERTGRQLDRLDRELAKAAEDLLREAGLSADDLQQAAEDLNRMQQEQMSDKEKEELRQRLQELRELLRQQGQAGKQQLARLLKFGKRARGGSGQQGQGQGQQKGQEGQEGQEGEEGEGQEGQGQGKDGQGQQGQGQGQKWVIGPGGKKILVMQSGGGEQGGGEGQGNQPGNGGDKPGGEGSGQGGKEWGTGRGGEIAGQKTNPKVGTQDVQATGIDSGQGPGNSEVILSAAERGFKGKPYKKVYTDYRTVAEQQINKDKIPDGYRFYVQRYFQLIRPRE